MRWMVRNDFQIRRAGRRIDHRQFLCKAVRSDRVRFDDVRFLNLNESLNMARKRKRDWPQLVYKFAIVPDEIPEQLWAQAKQMQRLWNMLAIEHEYVRMSINKSTPEEERVERWQMFEREAAALNAESGLNWESDVLDKFTKACVAAAKQPGRGWPRTRKMTVSIPHRFTGGGAAVAILSSPRATRVRFNDPVSFAHDGKHSQCRRVIDGFFGLDNEARLHFRATVHRSIPATSIVKSVRLVGRQSVAFGWEWSLSVTVEEPPSEPRIETGKQCAIDVGWRKRGDALRIGYLVDTDGASEELLLPLDFSTKQSRRQRKRRPHFDQIPESHDELRELASSRDLALEELKRLLKTNLRQIPAGFEKMRSRGLVKLLRELPDEESACRKLIQDWLDIDRPKFRTETRARARFSGRRVDIYSCLASRLAKEYDEICVEDIRVSKIITDDDRDHALKASDRYHQIAATADFLRLLSNACRRRGSRFVKKTDVDSSATCSVCGEEMSTGAELVQQCENGHAMDQDHNAAMNLLSQTWGQSEQKTGLRRKQRRASSQVQ